ncbi:MAG: chemotaxis protein CheW [Chloroflexi bacterium]|nr:MAG: chemotaxis protein CheW [Chloroflexota bacterium]MBL1196958.1 purine-binding chemotaxis protein CheW [Chloroflexota bacterium]NOH14254.1 purine-binding chemotaxis protein CheW [Chloroflexota bacterium]
MEQQLVVFELAEEIYGIDIAHVESIIKVPKITPMPQSEHYVEGVINLRGEVVPVLDLRTSMDMPKVERTLNSRIVVVLLDEKRVGMIVDAVTEVTTITEDKVQEMATLGGSAHAGMVTGIAKIEEHLIICLDPSKMLHGAVGMVEVEKGLLDGF